MPLKREKRSAVSLSAAAVGDTSDGDDTDDDLDTNTDTQIPPVAAADASAAGGRPSAKKTPAVEKRRRVDPAPGPAAPTTEMLMQQQERRLVMETPQSGAVQQTSLKPLVGYAMQPGSGMAQGQTMMMASPGIMPQMQQMQQMQQMGIMGAQPAAYSPMWSQSGGGGGGGGLIMSANVGQPDRTGMAQMGSAAGMAMMAMNPMQQQQPQQMGLGVHMQQLPPTNQTGVATTHKNPLAGASDVPVTAAATTLSSNGASSAENEAATFAAFAEAEAASDADLETPNGTGKGVEPVDERLREQLSLYTQSTRMNSGVSSYDQTITILNSRVVQKSYGSEKRFFCPPPYVKLTGSGWLTVPPPTIQMSIDDNYTRNSPVDVEADGPNSYIARAKFLFISDTDKRKTFFLRVKVATKDGRDLGVFTSTPIKVISKPSKRKFSLSNIDMRIDSGAEISLFNRVRSQSGSTRFLQGSPAGFLTSTSVWGTFTIVRKTNELDRSLTYQQSSANFIHYNMDVYLKCRLSNLMSSTYVIRKVEKNVIIKDESDPVSQLQKVAFYIKGSNRMYLTVPNENVTVQQSTGTEDRETVPEQSIWTIGSAEMKEYTFCEGLRAVVPGKAPLPINPVPVVKYVKTLGPLIELFGENFSSDLKVWFDDVPAVTIFRCEELLLCKPPDIARFGTGTDGPRTVQLVLVRNDGIIYRANQKYMYSPNSYTTKGGMAGGPAMLDDAGQQMQQQQQQQHAQAQAIQQQQQLVMQQQQLQVQAQQQQMAIQQQMLMQQAMMREIQMTQQIPQGMPQRPPGSDPHAQMQFSMQQQMNQQMLAMQQQQMQQPGPT